MVMNELWVRALATSSISGLHDEYPYHTNLDILAKSKQIILFSKIFFSLPKVGIALMVWETFYNVKNGKQILLIPFKTWGCAQYPRWCECWNYFWLDPFFKSWPLGMLLAEMLQRFSISYQNSPAKDSDSKVKSKMLDFDVFTPNKKRLKEKTLTF